MCIWRNTGVSGSWTRTGGGGLTEVGWGCGAERAALGGGDSGWEQMVLSVPLESIMQTLLVSLSSASQIYVSAVDSNIKCSVHWNLCHCLIWGQWNPSAWPGNTAKLTVNVWLLQAFYCSHFRPTPASLATSQSMVMLWFFCLGLAFSFASVFPCVARTQYRGKRLSHQSPQKDSQENWCQFLFYCLPYPAFPKILFRYLVLLKSYCASIEDCDFMAKIF